MTTKKREEQRDHVPSRPRHELSDTMGIRPGGHRQSRRRVVQQCGTRRYHTGHKNGQIGFRVSLTTATAHFWSPVALPCVLRSCRRPERLRTFPCLGIQRRLLRHELRRRRRPDHIKQQASNTADRMKSFPSLSSVVLLSSRRFVFSSTGTHLVQQCLLNPALWFLPWFTSILWSGSESL